MITALIAGIGGASLGTEIAKALRLAGGYRIIGCDVSPLAFGHYCGLCDKTILVDSARYIDHVLEICQAHAVEIVIPGADQPTSLIAAASDRFRVGGIRLGMNAPDLVLTLVDKEKCFRALAQLGFVTPRTVPVSAPGALDDVPLPCVVKPSVESGGSAFVFFAREREEAKLYAAYLTNSGKRPIAQAYLPHDRGEFTVGILSEPDGSVAGAIVMKRAFPAKLSIMAKGHDFVISSGVSQGHIGDYPDVEKTACDIARALGSSGPLNIQGRVDHSDRFVPFEINPRFSATTYLRALAGFNEVDYYARRVLGASSRAPLTVRPGWYLRGLTEVVVRDEDVVS
jgi:carbamoyl-phosphate synthase large subunit